MNTAADTAAAAVGSGNKSVTCVVDVAASLLAVDLERLWLLIELQSTVFTHGSLDGC